MILRYCMSMKTLPILYVKLRYKVDHDFLNMQYIFAQISLVFCPILLFTQFTKWFFQCYIYPSAHIPLLTQLVYIIINWTLVYV
mgnify:CR=1 FL=1